MYCFYINYKNWSCDHNKNLNTNRKTCFEYLLNKNFCFVKLENFKLVDKKKPTDI